VYASNYFPKRVYASKKNYFGVYPSNYPYYYFVLPCVYVVVSFRTRETLAFQGWRDYRLGALWYVWCYIDGKGGKGDRHVLSGSGICVAVAM